MTTCRMVMLPTGSPSLLNRSPRPGSDKSLMRALSKSADGRNPERKRKIQKERKQIEKSALDCAHEEHVDVYPHLLARVHSAMPRPAGGRR